MPTPDQIKYFMRGLKAKKPVHVSVDRLETHPNYPVERLDDIKEIEESIKRVGFDERQPVRVIPHPTKPGHYQVMDGHRRLQATKNCLHGSDCPEHLSEEVPVIIEDYTREDLDTLKHQDNWERLIPQKGNGGANYKNPKYCPQCGTKIMPGDNFCPECGFKLQ